MKKLIFILPLLLIGCKQTPEDLGPVLETQILEIADSLRYGNNTAEVTISGQFPTAGRDPLAGACRNWLCNCLTWGAYSTQKPIIHASQTERANPERLLAHLSKKILDSARRDFISHPEDPKLGLGYEYKIQFEPEWVSDSIVSYEYSAYCYMGGAHGGTVTRTASFAVSTGELLTYDNAFIPSRRRELISLIRQNLWTLYFQPMNRGDQTAPKDLADVLLIKPQDLQLPSINPQFLPNGIEFTYGEYEIAPYSDGMPSCVIPYDQLRPLLSPLALQLLNL